MNELERLLHGSANQRTRALLRAARSEAPPDDFNRRLLVGVNAAVSLAGASSAAASLTVATGVQGAALSGGKVASSLALATAKWVAVGMIGGGMLAAGAELAFAPAAREAPRTAPELSTKTAAVVGDERVAVRPAPVENVPATEIEAAAPASSPAGARLVASASARAGQLGREVAMIDRARRSLSARDYAQALAALDDYARGGTTGALDREARVLRIEALRRSGDVAGAERLAAQYLSDFPNDAHGTRLRTLDAGSSP